MTKLGQQRLLAIVGRITQQPNTWKQSVWHTHCGTAHCVAGHAEIDAGFKPNLKQDNYNGAFHTTKPRASEWLQLTDEEADWLFDEDRELEDLQRAAVTGKCF